MSTKIAIIGAGNIGRAIAHMIRDKKYDVRFYDKDESKLETRRPLTEVAGEAEIVFLCVNSWSARTALEEIAPHLQKDAILVSPIKGIEDKSLFTVDEIMEDVLPDGQLIALLNGPMLAAEMMEGQPAFAALASEDRAVCQKIEDIFSDTQMHVLCTDDIHGVAVSGVLKNVYSIGLGMTEAMEHGSNFRGWFVRQSCAEMAQIIEQLGGRIETAYGPAGLGDLVATGFSPHSRNCRAGQEVVRSGECITISEGHMSLPQLIELLKGDTSHLHLLHLIRSVLIDKQDAKAAFAALLQ